MDVAGSDFVPRTGHSDHRPAEILVIQSHCAKHRTMRRALGTLGHSPTAVFESTIGHKYRISFGENREGYHAQMLPGCKVCLGHPSAPLKAPEAQPRKGENRMSNFKEPKVGMEIAVRRVIL